MGESACLIIGIVTSSWSPPFLFVYLNVRTLSIVAHGSYPLPLHHGQQPLFPSFEICTDLWIRVVLTVQLVTQNLLSLLVGRNSSNSSPFKMIQTQAQGQVTLADDAFDLSNICPSNHSCWMFQAHNHRFLDEEGFINAVAPSNETFHKIHKSQYSILFKIADLEKSGKVTWDDFVVFQTLLKKPDAEFEWVDHFHEKVKKTSKKIEKKKTKTTDLHLLVEQGRVPVLWSRSKWRRHFWRIQTGIFGKPESGLSAIHLRFPLGKAFFREKGRSACTGLQVSYQSQSW